MKLEAAEKLGKELIATHLSGDNLKRCNISDVKFEICALEGEEHKTTLGICTETSFDHPFTHHPKKIYIRLNEKYVQYARPWEVKNTVLHEVAHAIAGGKHGHDETWQAICIVLGAIPIARISPYNSYGASRLVGWSTSRFHYFMQKLFIGEKQLIDAYPEYIPFRLTFENLVRIFV